PARAPAHATRALGGPRASVQADGPGARRRRHRDASRRVRRHPTQGRRARPLARAGPEPIRKGSRRLAADAGRRSPRPAARAACRRPSRAGSLRAMTDVLSLRRLLARAALRPHTGLEVDFASPPGEPALVGPDSVAWQVFRNPVALFVGGVAAVVLELAEPRVRTGVWEHTTFRTDPLTRMERTGLAAMVTVYAARSVA